MNNVLLGVLGKKPNESLVGMVKMLATSIKSHDGSSAMVTVTGDDVLWQLASNVNKFTHCILFPPTWEGNADAVQLETLCGCIHHVDQTTQVFVETENYLHSEILAMWSTQKIQGGFHSLQTVDFLYGLGLIGWRRPVRSVTPFRPNFVQAN